MSQEAPSGGPGAGKVIAIVVGVVLLLGLGLCCGGALLYRSLAAQLGGLPSVPIQGSGVVVTEAHTVAPFERLTVTGSTKVLVRIGSPQSVEVETDDNLHLLVDLQVHDGDLHVDTIGSWNSDHGVIVRITVPRLTGIDVSGASHVEVDGLDGDALDVWAEGAAQVRVSGAMDVLNVAAEGAAKIDAVALPAGHCSVEAEGAAQVDVTSTSTLDVTASGAAKVTYVGGADGRELNSEAAASISSRE